MPFPYSDLTAVKKRPVLVISDEVYNSAGNDIIICGVTSNPRRAPYSVIFENSDLVSGSIPSSSRIKTDKIFTLEKSGIIKKLAKLSDKKVNEVKDQMINIFAF
jgi:mRNA interferase MazF